MVKILAIILLIIFLVSLRNKYMVQKNVEIDEVNITKTYKCRFPSGLDITLTNPYYEDHDVIELPPINPCRETYVPIGSGCVKACRTCKIGRCMDGLCHN